MSPDENFDQIAEAIFARAIMDHRCGELLEALFNGAYVTLDRNTGNLVIIPGVKLA